MSFTTKVKEELLKMDHMSQSEKLAFLSGFVRNNAAWEEESLMLSSERKGIIDYVGNILEEEEITFEKGIKNGNNFNKNKLYLILITQKVNLLLDKIAYQQETPPLYLVDGNEEARCYIRGVFLNSGSVNDPKTSRYHMEIIVNYPDEAIFIQKILNRFDLNAKLLNRDKGYMIYLKEAEKISDFLKILGASKAVLYFEDVRIYHEKKNETNRLNNCEQANMDRVIANAMEQLKQIQVLRDNLAIELLDDKTKEALIYREKYKEASLKELSEIITLETGKKITKSGLNHRFRKIKELAQKFMEQGDTNEE